MAEELLVCLSQDKTCAKCQKTISKDQHAVRKVIKETRRTSGSVNYYHPGCWEVKKL